MLSYTDRWIGCHETAIVVRAYYFPWGTKRIPYDSIRSAVIVPIGPGLGKGRIWGTTNPSLWASLDPQRSSKHEALILRQAKVGLEDPGVSPEAPCFRGFLGRLRAEAWLSVCVLR